MRAFTATASLLAAMLAGAADGGAQSQMELYRQSAEDFQSADRQLNAVYTKMVARISPAGKASLQAAQLTWIRFRDQECEFEAMATIGGSIHPLIVNACLARLTIQRTKDLEHQLNCQEGDLSCARQ